MDKRLRNKGLWLSFASLLFLILQDCGLLIDPERYNMYANLLTSIGYCLLGFGVYSNPETDNRWYGRDKDNDDISKG